MNYPKYYCKKDGKLCKFTLKPSKDFDSKTGKRELPDGKLTCPNYKWYWTGGHFNESVSKDIEGNWFYGSANEFGPFYIYVKGEQ